MELSCIFHSSLYLSRLVLLLLSQQCSNSECVICSASLAISTSVTESKICPVTGCHVCEQKNRDFYYHKK